MLLCFAPYKGEWPEINSSLTPTVYSSFFVFFFQLQGEVWRKLFEKTWRRSEDLFEQAVGFVSEL